MGSRLAVFVLLTAALSGVYAMSTFDAGRVPTRGVTASVVGDASSYLALSVNTSVTYECTVQTGNQGDLVLAFDDLFTVGPGSNTCDADGGGLGIARDSTYYFDNLIHIHNQGTKDAFVYANATATQGTIQVCLMEPPNVMGPGCYSANEAAIKTVPGDRLVMGVMIDTTGLAEGVSVTGSIAVSAGRSA